MLLAVDPSLTNSGWALFDDQGALIRCGAVPTYTYQTMPQRIAGLSSHLARLEVGSVDTLVAEWPEAYRGKKINPNTLFGLCGIVGAVTAIYPDANAFYVKPREWTGQQTKHDRNDYYRSLLTQDELGQLRLVSARTCPHPPGHSGPCSGNENDVMDAISLGKWWMLNRAVG